MDTLDGILAMASGDVAHGDPIQAQLDFLKEINARNAPEDTPKPVVTAPQPAMDRWGRPANAADANIEPQQLVPYMVGGDISPSINPGSFLNWQFSQKKGQKTMTPMSPGRWLPQRYL